NPLMFLKTKYKYNSDNLISSGNISYEIAPGLRVKALLGYNSIQLNELTTTSQESIRPSFPGNRRSAISNINSIKTWIIEPQAEYERTVGKGKISVLLGSTFQQNLQQGQLLRGLQFASDALLENLQAAPVLAILANPNTTYRYNAIFGRFNYTLS